MQKGGKTYIVLSKKSLRHLLRKEPFCWVCFAPTLTLQ